MKFSKSWCLFFGTILFFSCSQVLDFDQVSGYQLQSSFTTSLAYFEITAANFSGTSEITEKSDIKVFNTEFLKESLSKIELNFEVKNEFNTGFNIEILLLDNNNNILYKTGKIAIAAKSLEYDYQEIIELSTHPEVKNFSRIEVVLSLEEPLLASDNLAASLLGFKSSFTIHFGKSL